MLLNNLFVRKLAAVGIALTLLLQTPMIVLAEDSAGGIRDVELREKGILTTRVVDMQGQPVAGEKLSVLYQGREVASAVSDQNGYVVIGGLRPGAHTLSTPMNAVPCRFWNKDTAPPSAVGMPAVVSDVEIVRGQFGAFNLPMVLYAGVSAAALIVAIDAENAADDALGANAALQRRVEALESASP